MTTPRRTIELEDPPLRNLKPSPPGDQSRTAAVAPMHDELAAILAELRVAAAASHPVSREIADRLEIVTKGLTFPT